MTQHKFRRLKVGDRVTLVERRPAYSQCYPTVDGRAFLPPGSEGVVGAVRVPSVTGRNGVARLFVCVDFPPDQALTDVHDHPFDNPNPHNNRHRVAAYPEELQ